MVNVKWRNGLSLTEKGLGRGVYVFNASVFNVTLNAKYAVLALPNCLVHIP